MNYKSSTNKHAMVKWKTLKQLKLDTTHLYSLAINTQGITHNTWKISM